MRGIIARRVEEFERAIAHFERPIAGLAAKGAARVEGRKHGGEFKDKRAPSRIHPARTRFEAAANRIQGDGYRK